MTDRMGWLAWVRDRRSRENVKGRRRALPERRPPRGGGSGRTAVGRPCAAGRADRGSVTAEFAVVLPAVMVMALLLMALTRTVTVTMRCQDAAAEAVRELVVAGDRADPQGVARAVVGADVSVAVNRAADLVTVDVTCPVIPDPLGVLPTKVVGEAVGVVP